MTKLCLAVAVVAVFAASHLGKALLGDARLPAATGPPQRIVSTAPSLTEVLFALELAPRVAGVTSYCRYPAEAQQKPKIGGYLNPNLEAIVALRPDLVVTLAGEAALAPSLARLGIRTLVADHKSIEGIMRSIGAIGAACNAQDQSSRVLGDMGARLDRVAQQVAGRRRPRVLFAVDRTLNRGRLEDVYIAGADGHIDPIVTMAGGQNAYRGSIAFPVVAREGMIQMNPDVIVDLVGGMAAQPTAHDELLAPWRTLDEVAAVRNGRVYIIQDDYAFIPGPRFVLLVEKLARLIHPDADWSSSGRPERGPR